MKNYDESVEINHNPNLDLQNINYQWFWILNSIKYQQLDINKTQLYVKDPFESIYHLLINGREKVGIENLKSPKVFIDYSQIDDVYETWKTIIL